MIMHIVCVFSYIVCAICVSQSTICGLNKQNSKWNQIFEYQLWPLNFLINSTDIIQVTNQIEYYQTPQIAYQ